MNKSRFLSLSLLVLGMAATVSISRAGDLVTITGEAKCAMRDLKAYPKCQTVVQVKDGSGTVEYYIANNQLAMNFHHLICKNPQQVTATGTVDEKNGRLVLLPTKLEIVPGATPTATAPAPQKPLHP